MMTLGKVLILSITVLFVVSIPCYLTKSRSVLNEKWDESEEENKIILNFSFIKQIIKVIDSRFQSKEEIPEEINFGERFH